jgi:3-methylfumaryl-CoA hydratase
MTLAHPRDWIGTERHDADRLDPARAGALAATLDRPAPATGEALPLLWHWSFFWEPTPTAGLGVDGHAAPGDFLPPVDLPHRMWAGGRVRCDAPLTVGAIAWRMRTVRDVREKTGRSGRLVFVTVRAEITDDAGGHVVEDQDLVYREPRAAPPPGEPAEAGAWRRVVHPDPVWLFRYSALTFNGHRIHYDRAYATEREGYAGLVVHGPLMATLLLDLVRHEGGQPAPGAFAFRAQRPVLDTAPFTLHGRPGPALGDATLWVANGAGECAMTAEAHAEPDALE